MANDGAARIGVVGAGPGDPGLITCRGRELLEQAEVVILDDFLAEAFDHILSKSCERFVVGRKVRGFTPLRTEDVCERLIERALRGKAVVRLKTGDPFLFGSGCEELIACRAANLPVEIVPGVSRLFAGPALAGIPLLLRGVSGSVLVLPGRIKGEVQQPTVVEAPEMLDEPPERQVGIVIRKRRHEEAAHGTAPRQGLSVAEGKGVVVQGDTAWGVPEMRLELASPTEQSKAILNPEDSGIVGGGRAPEEAALSVEDFTVDWAIVCKSAETLVFEAVQDVAIIQQGLLAGGRSASEPVGIVHVRGQHADPPVVTTIGNMGRAVEEEKIKPPFTLVVGDVVALREHLAHSAERPLRGLRVAVTQGEDLEEDLETKLRLEGARPVFLPLLQHSPLTAVEEVLAALRDDLARGDVLIVDSARSARLLTDSLERAWMDWRVLSPNALVIGVGSAASRALERRGLRTEMIERATLRPDAILALIERDCNGLHVLLAGVEGSLRDVAEELIARGASALEIPLAETQKVLANVLALKNALARKQLDAVLFTSPDEVRVCVEAWGAEPTRTLLDGVLTIAWDPATAVALRNSKITPDIVSPRSEADAVLPLLAEKMGKVGKGARRGNFVS